MKSMDSIDVSNRKPRRFKGTPTYKLRNVITVAVVAYTLVTGAIYIFSPLSRNIRNAFEVLGSARKHDLEDSSSEEKYNRNLMSLRYRSVFDRHQPNALEETITKTGE